MIIISVMMIMTIFLMIMMMQFSLREDPATKSLNKKVPYDCLVCLYLKVLS